MDSNTHEIVDPKAEFRKPLNDSGNRKYRRRSPLNGSSSSSGGSPGRERISSPIQSRKDVEEIDGDKRRDGHRNLDQALSRSQYSRSGELNKHSDRQSSRNSHSYRTHDDYRRRYKHVDEYDRDYPKSSSRSDRNSRDCYNSNHASRDYEHRSREYPHDVDKYSQDKSDNLGHRSRDKDKDSSSDRAGSGRRYTSFEDGKSGERYIHGEDRDGRDGKTNHRRGSGDYRNDRLKEASRRETKELNGEKYTIEEKKRFDDRDKYKERHSEEPEEHSEDRKALSSKDQESIAKKPKLFSSDSTGSGKANLADGQSSSSKQAQVASGRVPSEQTYVTDSDIDAAKTAAMKAAELVHKNLVGTGYMSTDQKKKLLWGNKKSTTTEESVHNWDTATFGDRERQEKFNKLMSLRLPWYHPIVGRERGRKSGAKARQPRRGEAKGEAPIGSREAIHCWIASKGWSDSWSGSLRITYELVLVDFMCSCYVASSVILFALVCWSVIKYDKLEIMLESLAM